MVLIPASRPPTHPGAMLLEELLKPLGLTQKELASRIGVSYPRVNEVIHGKRGVTPDTALRLSQLLGTSPQFWLNLQMAWDLYATSRSGSARSIQRIRPLRRAGRSRAAA